MNRDPVEFIRYNNNRARVLALALDGKWHTTLEFQQVGGLAGDRRRRELEEPWCGSMQFEKREHPSKMAEFRLRLETVDPVWKKRVLEGDVSKPGIKAKTKQCPCCRGTGIVPIDLVWKDEHAIRDVKTDPSDEVGESLDRLFDFDPEI